LIEELFLRAQVHACLVVFLPSSCDCSLDPGAVLGAEDGAWIETIDCYLFSENTA
jgi:hypothetical protein